MLSVPFYFYVIFLLGLLYLKGYHKMGHLCDCLLSWIYFFSFGAGSLLMRGGRANTGGRGDSALVHGLIVIGDFSRGGAQALGA